MHAAVISDIHADLPALKSVLAAIEASGVDEIWCLGDIVGLGGQEPADVIDLVRHTCTVVIGGNHDAWVTGVLDLDMLPLPRQRRELLWQRDALALEQLQWLASRPARAKQGENVELWHGSALDPLTGSIRTPGEAAEHLEQQHAGIGLVGHTHRPIAAHRDGKHVQWYASPAGALSLSARGPWVLNPGPVRTSKRWLELDLTGLLATWRAASWQG